MSRRLVCIDPGETSGFVVFDLVTGDVVTAGAYEYGTLMENLRTWLGTKTVEIVVYEQFRLYGGRVGASKSFSDLPEVRIIGSITYLCEEYGVPTAKLPAGVYKSATVQWLPPRDKIKGAHMTDAWRLGLWFLAVRLATKVRINLKSGRKYLTSSLEGREITNG